MLVATLPISSHPSTLCKPVAAQWGHENSVIQYLISVGIPSSTKTGPLVPLCRSVGASIIIYTIWGVPYIIV